MTHPIVALQGMLAAAFAADDELTALVGAGGVFEAPPRDRAPPYAVIVGHDIAPRDADAAPGYEHRLTIHCWTDRPSRKGVLAIAERILAVATSAPVAGACSVTHRRHERTETTIDPATGYARAAVVLRFYTE